MAVDELSATLPSTGRRVEHCRDSSGLNASALLGGIFQVLEWDESIASHSSSVASEASLQEQSLGLDATLSRPKTPSNNSEVGASHLVVQNLASPQHSGRGIWALSPSRSYTNHSPQVILTGEDAESQALSPVTSPSVDSIPSPFPTGNFSNRPVSAASSVFTVAPLLPSERRANFDATAFTVSFHALNDSVSSPSVLIRSLQLDLSELVSLGSSPTRKRLRHDQVRDLPRVRYEEPDLQSCSVCLEAFRQGMLLTKLLCGHVFHVGCFADWAQRSAQCPNCRASVLPP